MKSIIIIACILGISFSVSYGEITFPKSIQNEIKHLYSENNLDTKTVNGILHKLSDQKVITIHKEQQIYQIPAYGMTDFIKISGRIAEFGKNTKIILEISGPNGYSKSISSPLLQTGQYSTVYPIDWKSKTGTYKVQAVFAGEPKSESFFHLTKNKSQHSTFPSWLVTSFEWWAQNKISNSDLLYSIQYLADLGLIVNSQKDPKSLQVVITGQDMVRRGTTHTIEVLVTDGYSPIEGAKVTLDIEDYGENIIREFDGFTNPEGKFVFSWEVPTSFNDYETLLAFISVSGNDSSQTHLWKFQIYCLPGTTNCKIDGN